MKDKICINCFISGRVQGVWFRANTQKEAQKLGVNGWVRNLQDGRVEVMACGTADQLEQLKAWLRQGPEKAEVTDFECHEIPCQNFKGFDVV
jgi:acylphosphatase